MMLARARFTGYFDSPSNAAVTLALGAILAWIVTRAAEWALFNAAFSPTPVACAERKGACWSVVVDMFPLFLVGLYPAGERWRVIIAALLGATSLLPLLWRPARRHKGSFALVAVSALTSLVVLHGDDRLGLPVVDPTLWGGALLTAVLAVYGQTIAFPLGVLLALGRTSTGMPFAKYACAVAIEAIRSVPLVVLLLLATLVLPLFLPQTVSLNRMMTAQLGFILFSAATYAEVVRAGLLGVPMGQIEASRSLGLSRALMLRLVILPQALRIVLPALVGTLISFVKGSSLVVAIGLYDLLGAAMLAAANEKWVGHSIEPLVFVGAVFWAICFALSRLALRLERRGDERATSQIRRI